MSEHSRIFWTQRQDLGPSPRSRHALAFDSARNRVVLFGGTARSASSSDNFGDTWEWDGDLWVQVAQFGPPAMATHAMSFDSKRKRVVLFGGSRETWEWDGQAWTQVADTGPPGVGGIGMVYDAEREHTLLFGGFGDVGSGDGYHGGSWQWDGTEWTQISESGPRARSHYAMVYDNARQRVVLFGGWSPEGVATRLYGDTWEWDGASWEQVAAFGPSARVGHGMAFDAERSRVVLFGGSDTLGSATGPLVKARRDTWEWNGQRWYQVRNMGPSARVFHAVTFDLNRRRMLLFGGMTNESPSMDLEDTWEFGMWPPNTV